MCGACLAGSACLRGNMCWPSPSLGGNSRIRFAVKQCLTLFWTWIIVEPDTIALSKVNRKIHRMVWRVKAVIFSEAQTVDSCSLKVAAMSADSFGLIFYSSIHWRICNMSSEVIETEPVKQIMGVMNVDVNWRWINLPNHFVFLKLEEKLRVDGLSTHCLIVGVGGCFVYFYYYISVWYLEIWAQ